VQGSYFVGGGTESFFLPKVIFYPSPKEAATLVLVDGKL